MVKARMTTTDVAAEVKCLRRLIGMRLANVYDITPKVTWLPRPAPSLLPFKLRSFSACVANPSHRRRAGRGESAIRCEVASSLGALPRSVEAWRWIGTRSSMLDQCSCYLTNYSLGLEHITS